MRVGFNPNKDKIQHSIDFFHQVIIPVYIPNNDGYFKNSFKILEYCLQSLFKTSHSKTFISIINNGSNEEVREYLDKLYRDGNIHELVHTNNIGKLNGILKGISGYNFEIVTIADADVLFLNHWQKATYQIFKAFPKTGAVCPTPSSKVLKQHTYNVIFENFFSRQLRFTRVKNPEAMIKFSESIDNSKFYNEYNLKYNLTISKENTKAVLGAGHFVTSYNGRIFNKLKERFSNFGLGGDSEDKFLDRPVADQGYWRLSTEDNFAYHMGNVMEEWMHEQLNKLEDESEKIVTPPNLKNLSISRFRLFIRREILMKILMKKSIWIFFLQFKGLSKQASMKY